MGNEQVLEPGFVGGGGVISFSTSATGAFVGDGEPIPSGGLAEGSMVASWGLRLHT